MNTDQAICEAPNCNVRTDDFIDLWSCYHMFYFCSTHMLEFVNVLYAGHTGHCAECGKSFVEDTVGVSIRGETI